MSGFGSQIIFKELLERHHRIEIPMIQRDFAQGRESEEEIRDEFLNALYNALALPAGHESLPLNLDFVYGSVEGETETRFSPLDGQQRLTTLFLLHWYLAWQEGRFDVFQEMFRSQKVSRFFYSVRPSSTEFFNALVNFWPDEAFDDVRSPKDIITNQPWYFRYWRLDQTIQSSLTMLDAIHDLFGDAEGLFARLVDTEQPSITFQLLDLENFGLSDDLYIKMNARGKPLTAFETFKARYEQSLKEQFPGESRIIGKQSFSVADYFALRMDTRWADFFWHHRDKETNRYDSAVMNLFRVVVLISRDPDSETYIKNITQLRGKFFQPSHSAFQSSDWLDQRFSETLFLLLETWAKEGEEFATQLPYIRFFDEIAMFEKAMTKPVLEFTEIVLFVAYIEFLREHGEGDIDQKIFQEWMRIIFNLAVNTTYNRPPDMRQSIRGVLKLVSHSGNILEHFAGSDKPTKGFYQPQIHEEKVKAELIRADDGWRALIDQAEGHGYFRGQIGFLLDFCGVDEKIDESKISDWTKEEHLLLQKQFANYLAKAEVMFNKKGLKELDDYRWERALLSIGNYLLPSGYLNFSFLVNSSTEHASWKRLLRGTGDKAGESRAFLQELLDNIEVDLDINNQLDVIIKNATGLEPWRQSFVCTPQAIDYCRKRLIRWNSEDEIYLLSKSQMNGYHAELFTFCLYHNLFKPLSEDGKLVPLKLYPYIPVTDTETEPGIRFIWSNNEDRLNFEFERSGSAFELYVMKNLLSKLPEVVTLLVDTLGFREENGYLRKSFVSAAVQTEVSNFAKELGQLSRKENPDV